MKKNSGHKSDKTVTFRLEKKWETPWNAALQSTGLRKSELAREVFMEGFQRAVNKSLKKTEKKLERAKGFEPSTFTLATWGPARLCAGY